jgi:hypothetical protein
MFGPLLGSPVITIRRLAVLSALGLAPALAAQSSPAAPVTPPVAADADAALRRALELPHVVQRARAAGIVDAALRDVVVLLRDRGVSAADAATAVEVEIAAAAQGGDREGFGALVRAQVAAGLRGRELAAAMAEVRQLRGLVPEGLGEPPGRGLSEDSPVRSEPPGAPSASPESRRPSRRGRPDRMMRYDTRGTRPSTAGPPRTRSDSADKPPTRGERP